MAYSKDSERRPLLEDSVSSIAESGNPLDSQPTRAVEDDVLPEESTLGRTLTWQSAYILVISRVIGSGIFATPGAILQSVGSVGLSLTLWLVGAAIAACGLAVSLEFGSMLPRSGGDKVYLEFTYRRPRFLASTLVAIYVVLLGFTASNCIVFSQYILFALKQHDASNALRKAIAAGLLSAVTIIHGVFPRTGVRLQNLLGWIKIVVIGLMIVSGIYVVLFRSVSSESSPQDQLSWEHLWDNSNWNWGIISTSLFKVFYSFAGLDNAGNVLNEVKDPVRTLRSVTSTAFITVCAMYTLINISYFLVVPLDEIKRGGELVAALFFERVWKQLWKNSTSSSCGAFCCWKCHGGCFCNGKQSLQSTFLSRFTNTRQGRVKQEIARQGFLPFSGTLSSTKPFGSPLGAFIVHFIPSFLVIVVPPSQNVYSFILEVEGYPGQMFGLAVAVGLVYLRFKRPDLKRPFKAWLPAVFLKIVLSCALLTAPFVPPPEKPANGLFYATYALVGITM